MKTIMIKRLAHALVVFSITLSSFGQPVTQVTVGQLTTFFIRADGSLWGMGFNSYGQLGVGNTANTNRPAQILASGVAAIATGGNHTLFVKTNGSLWGMGWNSNPILSLGAGVPQVNQQSPVLIDDSSVVTSIAAGANHSMYVKGGGLWVMGAQGSGQLGTGSFLHNTNYFPERIETLGVVAIAAGWDHSLWVKSDGSLWGTGFNTSGQLGNGTNNFVYSPIQILSSNVIAAAAGRNHSLILKNDGSLWGMGANGLKQLGFTNFSSTNLPVMIVASNVTAIAAAENHSLFLKSDGSLWGMGGNSWGELGVVPVGNIIYSNQPVRIAQSGVVSIAAGSMGSLYVKSDGSLWGMGANQYGELGMNSTGLAYPPTLIVSGKDFNKVTGEVLSNGPVRLTFEGILGSKYALEHSFSLSPSNWQPLVTNTAGAGGTLLFTNTPVAGTNNFWRVRHVP